MSNETAAKAGWSIRSGVRVVRLRPPVYTVPLDRAPRARTFAIEFIMNQSLPALLAVPFLTLCSCSGEVQPPAASKASNGPESREAKPVASAPSSAAAAPAAAAPAGAATAVATKAPGTEAASPANARKGGKRAQGADDNRLDSQYDLSKVKLDEGAVDDHGHDHDHGEPHLAQQDGSSLMPASQAQQNKGRFELADGAQQTWDFGKLRQGESASYEFAFFSKGEDPLVITGVKPSCGCTKAEIALLAEDGTKKPYVKGDPIAVGQKFVLESEISTDGKPAGPFNAQISLYGNDVRGTFNVRLTADIEPVLTITPSPTVFFGHLTTADKVEETVTVTSTRGEHFYLNVGQETIQEPVKIDYVAKDPDAEGRSNEWTIHIAFGPNAQIGMRTYPIMFRTDLPIAHPRFPTKDGPPPMHSFMLNVQAQVSGMVSAEPSFLTFGMVRPGEPLERSLRLQCHDDFMLRGDMAFVLEGLQGQELPFKDAFGVAIEPDADGKAANVKVQLKGMPQDTNGSFGGVLRLKVGHPYMDEVQVRFSGVCRPALPQATVPQPGQQKPQ